MSIPAHHRPEVHEVATEKGSDGYEVARDPRKMTQDELTRMGHKPMSAGEAIRAFCLNCCNGAHSEVLWCMALSCSSWPFRMGTSPWKAKKRLTDEQRAAVAARFAAARAARSGESAVEPSKLNAETLGTGVAATQVGGGPPPAEADLSQDA